MHTIDRLVALRHREHTSTVDLITVLCECVRREDHVAAGHASLWSLLTERLRYSPAAASRRNAAVKIALRYPVALDLLREHRTTLTDLARVAFLLREDVDFGEVLERIDGASSGEVQAFVARWRPLEKPVERVKRTAVRVATSNDVRPSERLDRDLLFSADSTSKSSPKSESSPAAEPTRHEPIGPTPATEDRVQITFSMTAEEYERLQRARAIASRKHGPGVTIEQTIGEMITHYVGRDERTTRKTKGTGSAAEPSTSESRRSRHVPSSVRREVIARDGRRCTHRGRDGTRCSATLDLQLDHVKPFAAGGMHTVENLRLLCGVHNRWRIGQRE